MPAADGVGAGRRASCDAFNSRLVVPSALVVPDRAEHTMATRCVGKYDSAMDPMLPRNLPTEVPPYFCTTQGTASSDELLKRRIGGDAVPVGVMIGELEVDMLGVSAGCVQPTR